MNCAIYARKSTEQNGVVDEARSVTRQIESARAYAERKGWTVDDSHIYVDDGISGAEFDKRPGFLRLMNALKPRPGFQSLIMSEESRLGREQIEVGFALKQLIQAGVRVFCYLGDTERTLNSPIEKAMLAFQTMADEMERARAAQRVTDAMLRKARAGHVTGGRLFGYRNVDVLSRGQRSHVERQVDEAEAAVVRRIFTLCAEGFGMKGIAHRLNAESAPSPRAQQGRPRGWAPSSVREVLYRDTYRGEVVWNKSKKRDGWGQQRQRARPEAEWVRVPAPELRIVSDEQWLAAHVRLAESRALYLRGTDGQLWGAPPRGSESKYLLVGLGRCGVCGSGVSVRSRKRGKGRLFFYVCTGYHLRGRHVCTNGYELPMEPTDAAVLGAIGEQVLSTSIIEQAIERATERLLSTPRDEDEAARLREDRRALDAELTRLTAALASGGEMSSVVAGICEREARRKRIDERLTTLSSAAELPTLDKRALRASLRRRVEEWRAPLGGNVAQARQMLRKVIIGRLTLTPDAEARRSVCVGGDGTLTRLLGGIVIPKGMASPQGFEPWFQP